jgi:hypothetical protein
VTKVELRYIHLLSIADRTQFPGKTGRHLETAVVLLDVDQVDRLMDRNVYFQNLHRTCWELITNNRKCVESE